MDFCFPEASAIPCVTRRYVENHRPWIEREIGCSLDEAVLLAANFPATQLALDHFLPGIPLRLYSSPVVHALRPLVEAVGLPPGVVPAIDVAQMRDPASKFTDPKTVWQATWQDCPVSVRIRGIARSIVLASVPLAQIDSRNTSDCVIAEKQCASLFLQLILELCPRGNSRRAWSFEGEHQHAATSGWDDLVLNESVVELVRRDFETFFLREDWFRRHRIPFRRGYLFHGPPGNGKTSVIRAMLASGNLAPIASGSLMKKRMMARLRLCSARLPAMLHQ